MSNRLFCGVVGFIAALTPLSSPSMAEGDTTGYVTRLDVQQNRIYVILSVPPGGSRPACADNATYAGIFPSTATYAQQFYAALLTAQSRGTTVRIQGTDTCPTVGSIEDISRIFVNNE